MVQNPTIAHMPIANFTKSHIACPIPPFYHRLVFPLPEKNMGKMQKGLAMRFALVYNLSQ